MLKSYRMCRFLLPPGRQQFGSPNLRYLVFFFCKNFEKDKQIMIFKNRSSGWTFAASVPSRLSHFVAPLYVAPSPTPSNATSQRRVFLEFFKKSQKFLGPLVAKVVLVPDEAGLGLGLGLGPRKFWDPLKNKKNLKN